MLDWDDLRFFLAVARTRTLSAAAKHLHVTQSTVGRRLAAMQNALGTRLLHRDAEGFHLTASGEAILVHAERIEAEAQQAEQAVAGQEARLAGVVRVACPAMAASHLLAACLAALSARSPSVMVEMLSCAPADPLVHHQADLALQLARFQHPDLVMRSLGSMGFGLYASPAYLVRCGAPDLHDGCAGQQLITSTEDSDLPQHGVWLAEHAARASIVLKSDNYEMQQQAALHGGGLALLPRCRGDAEPGLRRLPVPAPPPAEIWLGVHQDNRQQARIRTVLEAIAEAVRAQAATLDPA